MKDIPQMDVEKCPSDLLSVCMLPGSAVQTASVIVQCSAVAAMKNNSKKRPGGQESWKLQHALLGSMLLLVGPHLGLFPLTPAPHQISAGHNSHCSRHS